MAKGVPKPVKWRPQHPEKYVGDVDTIVSRSSWELHFMRYCDSNPAVIAWTSEYPIKYYSTVDEKVRRYFVDFFVKMRTVDGHAVLMIEVKPDEQCAPPRKPRTANHKSQMRYLTECAAYQLNVDKWQAAREFAEKNNMKFIILNEYDIGLKKRKT